MAKKNEKGKKSRASEYLSTEKPTAGQYSSHLEESRKPQTRYEEYRERLKLFLQDVHKKGQERLTIMVIPHTEKKILNLHISLYTITITLLAVALVLIVSVVSLVGQSGQDRQLYDMALGNEEFPEQSVKMAEEMIPLHQLIARYSSTMADLYIKLGGDESQVTGQGGVAMAVSDSEIEKLREMVRECRAQGEDCEQELTEEILRQVLYISEQDNHNLKRAVEISEKVLAELNTEEKQNLLRNTPSIWPTRGYLLSPYGWQTSPIQGREVFKRGIEIGANAGTEVYATAPGEVHRVTYDARYGLQIMVEHQFGIKTFYAHLDRATVRPGDKVGKGQVIGYVGRTGLTPVNMLYYEVHVGSVAYNPHAFLNHLQDQWLIQPRI